MRTRTGPTFRAELVARGTARGAACASPWHACARTADAAVQLLAQWCRVLGATDTTALNSERMPQQHRRFVAVSSDQSLRAALGAGCSERPLAIVRSSSVLHAVGSDIATSLDVLASHFRAASAIRSFLCPCVAVRFSIPEQILLGS